MGSLGESYSEQHERASSSLLNDIDWDECSKKVLCSVTGSQQLVDVGSLEPNRAVKCRSIVGDEVNSRNLLEHLVDIRQNDSVKFAIFTHIKQTSEASLGHLYNSLLDAVELCLDGCISARLLVESFQDFQGLVFSASHDEPSRRFGKIEDGHKDDYREENLERQGESPSYFTIANKCEAFAKMLAVWISCVSENPGETQHTVVNPVAETNSTSDEGTFDHYQFSSIRRFCRLGLPCWNSTCVDAVAYARDDSTNDEMRKRESCALQKSSSCHGRAAKHDGAASTKRVTDEDCDDSANETSQIVSGNRDALVQGTLAFEIAIFFNERVGRVDVREVFGERGKIQETTGNSLIVTKEP